ncbi:MAG: hypothetical protein IPN34_10220 [Planctomycetes bacterium]|nr:hypothetical protein [Planctomycetota bacterium]
MSRASDRPPRAFPEWLWFVAALLWIAAAPTHPDSWSDASRLATVESLLHRGTFRIDESPWVAVGDRILLPDGFRSHQPPFFSVLAVPISFCIEALGWQLAPESVAAHYLGLVALLVALPFALFVRALDRELASSRSPHRWVAPALLCASFATPYALVLNHHLPAATCAGIGLLALRRGEAAWRVGLWLGVAAALDLPAIGFALAAFALAPESGSRLRWTLGCAAGAAPALAAAGLLQLLSTGELAPGGLRSDAFAWPNSSFLFEPLTGQLPARSAAATWIYVLRGTVWNYGLFAYHPWLLLAAGGTLWSARGRGSTRASARAALAGGLAVLLLYGLFSENQGGSCFGVRWLVLLVPALALHTDRCPLLFRGRAARLALALLLLWSAFFAAVGAVAPFSRWNPFARHGDEAAADREAGRSVLSALVHEALRVRALGPRFDESYLRREYVFGLERRARNLERAGDLLAAQKLGERLASAAPEDRSSRGRVALAEARLRARGGDPAAALRAAKRGLELRPGEPALLLLAVELALLDLDWRAGCATEIRALARLVADEVAEPEPGWRERARALLERGKTSRSGFPRLPSGDDR